MTANIDAFAVSASTIALPDVSAYRAQIEKALKYTDGAVTFEDVEQQIEDGRLLFWPIGTESVVLTEITEYPQFRTLHIFCAAGRMEDIEAAAPIILDYGRHMGCKKATLVGRKGWLKSFLTRTGWVDTELVTMSKDL